MYGRDGTDGDKVKNRNKVTYITQKKETDENLNREKVTKSRQTNYPNHTKKC